MTSKGGTPTPRNEGERSTKKLRAVFLSALMVASVLAGTVAFSGTAAAANQPDDLRVSVGAPTAAGNVPIWVGATNSSTGPDKPVEGVGVTVDVTRPSGTTDSFSVMTGADGNANLTYSVSGDGTYQVDVYTKSLVASDSVTIGPRVVAIVPQFDGNLEVGRETNITVAVADSNGPVGSVTRSLTITYPDGKTEKRSVTTDADGFATVAFTPNMTGRYSFTAGNEFSESTAGVAVASVDVNLGGSYSDIVPNGTATINGRVHDDGQLYANKGIVVSIVNESASGNPVVKNISTTTNAQGQFLVNWDPSTTADASFRVDLYTAGGGHIAGDGTVSVSSQTTDSQDTTTGPSLELDIRIPSDDDDFTTPVVGPGGSTTVMVEVTENGDPVDGATVVLGQFYAGEFGSGVPDGRQMVTTNSSGEATATVTLSPSAPLDNSLVVEGVVSYNGSTATGSEEANIQPYEIEPAPEYQNVARTGTLNWTITATDPTTGNAVSGASAQVVFGTRRPMADAYPASSATTDGDGTVTKRLSVPDDVGHRGTLYSISPYIESDYGNRPVHRTFVRVNDFSVDISGVGESDYAQGETVSFNYTTDSSGNVSARVTVTTFENVEDNVLFADRVAPGEDVSFTVPTSVPNGTDFYLRVVAETETGTGSTNYRFFEVGGVAGDTTETTDTTAPTADTGPDRTVTYGDTVAFNASGSTDNVGIASYEWDFDGDGVVDATGELVEHTFDSSDDIGTNEVTLVVTDGAGNSDTATVNITVEAPTATPTPTPTPTATPTESPTPTDTPTPTPTDEPVDTPTETPTDEPTDTPTDEPEDTPADEGTEPGAEASPTGTDTGAPGFGPGLAVLALLAALALRRRQRR